MRSKLSWDDLQDERVGVWGLGTEGAAAVRRLRSMGVQPLLVDDRASAPDSDVLTTSEGGLDALLGCSVVVKTPGISRYRSEAQELERAGVVIVGGLGLWLAGVDRDRVICVTGSKGKSTTTSVAAHLANQLGHRALAGGNIGVPPYDPDVPGDVDLWIIEVSSYQATDIMVSPPIVVVTSLSEDHLPWHGSADQYYIDKLSLCTQPGAELTIAARTEALEERRGMLGPEVQWVDHGSWGQEWADRLGLVGRHNLVNANLARSALVAAGVAAAADDVKAAKACGGYEGLESRLELVGTVDGVDFVDDGLSTNVLPTLAAVESFPGRRVALIAGGFDRGIDYGPLADGLAQRSDRTLVLTAYATGEQIRAAVERVANEQLEARPVSDLVEAVHRGWEWARPDGVVLLSPAAASFDAFVDYRDRSQTFREAVVRLAQRTGLPVE